MNRLYGIKPWEMERLTSREVVAYMDDIAMLEAAAKKAVGR